MTQPELKAVLNWYRAKIDAMQGHVFFCEDEDGVLRRWHPPTRHFLDTENNE